MTSPNALLERYLRQRRELGEIELVMGEAVRLVEALSSSSAILEIDRSRMSSAEPRAGFVEPPTVPATTLSPRDTPVRPASGSGARQVAVSSPRVEPLVPPLRPAPELPTNHPLTVLNVAASGCTACGLAETRTHVVFGEGNPNARLMVVGEAPGADEDRSGRPFVGRAGVLLTSLLQSIGFPRESVYICNVLKCRPPGNRNPQPIEVEACGRFLRGQLEAISPRAVLAVGTFSAQSLLGTTEPIGRLRGKVHSLNGIPLVPTYHPAALLRNPGWIRPVWEDLQRLRQLLDEA